MWPGGRTLLQLAIGGVLRLIVIRRALFWLQSGVITHAKPANREALNVITGQVFHGLFTVTLWFLIGGLILVLLTLLSGPYRWAVATRSWARRTGASAAYLVSALAGRAASDETAGRIRRHLDIVRIAGAAVAALALLIFSVNWAGLLIVAVLLALYEYGRHRLRQLQPAGPRGIPPSPAPAPAGPAPAAAAGPLAPAGPGGWPGPAGDTSHAGHTAR